MCRRTTCKTCSKATYSGCGQHVDQVLRGVPAGQRCTGHATTPAAGGRSLLARLLSR